MPAKPNFRRFISLFAGVLLAAGGAPRWSEAAADRVHFNRDVRPILSQNCFFCHGPDEKHREADLRLDRRDGAARDLGGHAAIVPGNAAESELLARIESHDDDAVMPPPKSKKGRLSAAEIATLRRWIDEGAEYEGHWAFLPLLAEPPPAVDAAAGARNPIDRFIVARLAERGLRLSAEADRATLIRRASLDLTGLLPTAEEVERFERDPDPDAYDALIDRLLASPHYGERWARHWLDQARYADSNGYARDDEREMWPFRDWVIQALNRDLPFDRFTVEQLAGDLLPTPTKEQTIATAFHRNTLINLEGGSDPEQFRVEAVMDRVNTTGAVWLGLTVGCAQCHSHKFDPISQREYYQLFAFFNSTEDVNDRGPVVSVVRGELFGSPVTIPEDVVVDEAALAQRRAEWESKELAQLEAAGREERATTVWSPVHYEEYHAESNAGLRLLPDNSLLADGRGSFNDVYHIEATTTVPSVAAVRLRALTHESLPKNGPGLAGNGNFVLTEFELTIDGQERPFARAWTDRQQPGYPITAAIDDSPKTGWAINVGPGSTERMNADHEATFVLAEPLALTNQTLHFRLAHDLNKNYLVGRFAIDVAATVPPEGSVEKQNALLAALRLPAAKRSKEQAALVQVAFEKVEPRARQAAKKSNPDRAQLMVMRERKEPRETYLLTRGDFTRPDKAAGPVAPALLSALPSPAAASEQRLNRLDLARWLVSPDNPLTPRVTMNRLWMRYFGRGLVETDEDFGSQGASPTHPELLDWLAAELIRGGWSLKHMHRLIATSATYRQSSHARPELLECDPRNLLLGRQERLRLDAEIVRDVALSASGLLDRTIGGPSVHPPQPEGVYAFTQVNKTWRTEAGPNRYRRGLYIFFYRSAPYPLLTTFDSPDFQTVCTRRPRSNTPLQALNMANDAAFIEMARAFAARVTREAPGAAREQLTARIDRAFLLALCRQPSDRERSLLSEHFARQQAAFAQQPDLAAKLAAAAPSESTADAAALISVVRVILNTDNFITRE